MKSDMDKKKRFPGEEKSGGGTVSKATLESLRCEQCKRYLSNPPVFCLDSGESVCFNCANNKGFRNLTYERAVQDVNFPCLYSREGCGMMFPFGSVHEKFCKYRSFPCPLRDSFQGTVVELRKHLREYHAKMFVDELSFIISDSEIYKKCLFEIMGQIFLIKLYVNHAATRSDKDKVTRPQQCVIAVMKIANEEFEGKCNINFTCTEEVTVVRHASIRGIDSPFYECKERIDYLFKVANSKKIICSISIDSADFCKCTWEKCDLEIRKKDNSEHRQLCNKRTYKCFGQHAVINTEFFGPGRYILQKLAMLMALWKIGDCGYSGSLRELQEHLMSRHSYKIGAGSELVCTVESVPHFIVLIYNKEPFLCSVAYNVAGFTRCRIFCCKEFAWCYQFQCLVGGNVQYSKQETTDFVENVFVCFSCKLGDMITLKIAKI